jgi:hypothetical protein
MKRSRYLVTGLAASVVCAFAVFAAEQQAVAPSEGDVPAKDTNSEVTRQTSRRTQLRQALDANPSLVPWLLEQTATADEQERASAHSALYALAPIAASDIMKGLAHPNLAIRQTAMSLLPDAAAYPSFPLNEAITLLQRIAENENEDDTFRKQARMTVCQIICASQGTTIYLPQRPA